MEKNNEKGINKKDVVKPYRKAVFKVREQNSKSSPQSITNPYATQDLTELLKKHRKNTGLIENVLDEEDIKEIEQEEYKRKSVEDIKKEIEERDWFKKLYFEIDHGKIKGFMAKLMSGNPNYLTIDSLADYIIYYSSNVLELKKEENKLLNMIAEENYELAKEIAKELFEIEKIIEPQMDALNAELRRNKIEELELHGKTIEIKQYDYIKDAKTIIFKGESNILYPVNKEDILDTIIYERIESGNRKDDDVLYFLQNLIMSLENKKTWNEKDEEDKKIVSFAIGLKILFQEIGKISSLRVYNEGDDLYLLVGFEYNNQYYGLKILKGFDMDIENPKNMIGPKIKSNYEEY